MSLRFDDIPIIEGAGRLGRRPSPDSEVADAYRLPEPPSAGLLGSLKLSLGLDIQGMLGGAETRSPGITRMGEVMTRGATPAYTTYGDCAHYNYDGTCNEACFGFEPHHMDPFYCATCAEQAADPANNPAYFWHFVGSRGSLQYKDREPDVCAGKDAWKWKVGTCGQCQESAVFRCHDGYKKYPDNAAWDPTICQGLVICDGKLKTC